MLKAAKIINLDLTLLVYQSEEENDNIISMDEEIEKMLIDIYNKNISIISSGKKKKQRKSMSFLSKLSHIYKQHEEVLFQVLQTLDFKMKELIKKHKNKVYETEGIKELREKWVSRNQRKDQTNSRSGASKLNSLPTKDDVNNNYEQNNEYDTGKRIIEGAM